MAHRLYLDLAIFIRTEAYPKVSKEIPFIRKVLNILFQYEIQFGKDIIY